MLTTVLITVLISLLCVWCFTSECRKPICFPPGPVWLPFFGSSLQLKSLSRKFGGQHLALIKLLKKYSSDILGLKLGREYVIAVCSYSTVKKILTSEEYEGRPDNFFFRMRSMGTRKGITGTDGELWKEQRSFLVSHLRALGFGKNIVEDMVKHEICDVISKIDQNLKNVDIAVVLAPSVLNILWHLTSGKDLKDDENIDNLLKLLHKRAKAFDMSGGTLNLYPWIRFIAPEGSGYSLLKKINSEINKFIAETIKEHKKKWRDGQCDDVIYAYLNEMQKKQIKENNFTDDQLVMVCLDIFLAGSTTTTNTINFAFWSMIMYPEIQEKVHQCLTNAFHDKKDISYSDRTLVPYVEAVLLECQRYFPVVPVIGPRRVLRKTSLNNYVIPKDTTVLINIYSVHHDKEYWKDPETFRPERFLDSQGNLQNTERVLTFGLGKRRCLGDALAKSCIFLFFVTILRKYKLESVSQNSKGEKTITGINMTPGNYRVNCTPR